MDIELITNLSKDINNVKIYGKGKIDGNENIFHGEETEYYIEGKFYI